MYFYVINSIIDNVNYIMNNLIITVLGYYYQTDHILLFLKIDFIWIIRNELNFNLF